MLRINKVLLVAACALGLWSTYANAQDKHVTTINNCTVIDKPGAYVVGKVIEARVSDLTPLSGAFADTVGCIVINADLVTLNLGGNTIFGPGVAGIFGAGVAAVGRKMVKVHSGVVTNFNIGVLLDGADHTVQDVNSSYNFGLGIWVQGQDGHRIIGNIANRNFNNGILVQCPAVVLGNMATGSLNDLITLTTGPNTCTREHNNPFIGDQP